MKECEGCDTPKVWEKTENSGKKIDSSSNKIWSGKVGQTPFRILVHIYFTY